MSKIKRIYIFLFLACVFPFAVLAQSRGPVIDEIIAKVDNYIILRSDLEKSYREYMQEFNMPRNDAICEALRSLTLNKVMVAKAEIDSVEIEDEIVEGELNARMQYFVSQFGSEQRLEEYYKQTIEQFKDELRQPIRELLLAQKMQREITEKVKITPSEVRKFFNRIPADSLPFYSREVTVGQIVKIPTVGSNQKAKARQRLAEIRERIVNGPDITSRYKGVSLKLKDDNTLEVVSPNGTYKGEWGLQSAYLLELEVETDDQAIARLNGGWLVTKTGNPGELKLTSSDFDDAFNIVLSSGESTAAIVTQSSLAKTWNIVSVREGGESFAEMARLYSEDPGSSQRGGALGFHKRGELVPPYEAAAMNLKPGEISQPVESEYGFHLIQLLERRGNEYNSRHILIKFNSSDVDIEEASRYLDSLRTLILNDSITFEKAAKDHSDDKVTAASGGFILDPATGASSISVEAIDPVLFFTVDTMRVGDISRPMEFRMEDGKTALRIIYYKSSTPPHKANLKQDYQKIQLAALNQKKQKSLFDWFEEAKKEVFIEIDDQYSGCDILGSYGL